MSRTLAHSLHLLSAGKGWDFSLWSLYDSNRDLMAHYLPKENFMGFSKNRVSFIFSCFASARSFDLIIISHINLALVGLVIKLINPKCKIWLVAHGIEVWRPLTKTKRVFLNRCDKVLCVSNFTKDQMIKRHETDAAICEVLNNAVDPFIKLPTSFEKPRELLKRHRISGDAPIIFTLTRLASTEQYKGHDQVIKVISKLKEKFPEIRYILAGKYDHQEEIRIQRLISAANVEEQVILTGFIAESEIPDYFLLADLFVLPSKKEGFGIVFIEAMACGLMVICGNADGSIDAICNGKLGKAINTDDLDELENAIIQQLNSPLTPEKRYDLQQECLKNFNEAAYINRLEEMIING